MSNTISCPKCQRDVALMPAGDPANPEVTHRGHCTACGTVSLVVETTGEDGLPVLQLAARRAPRGPQENYGRRKGRVW